MTYFYALLSFSKILIHENFVDARILLAKGIIFTNHMEKPKFLKKYNFMKKGQILLRSDTRLTQK